MDTATKQLLLRLRPGVKQLLLRNAKKLDITASEYVANLVNRDSALFEREKS